MDVATALQVLDATCLATLVEAGVVVRDERRFFVPTVVVEHARGQGAWGAACRDQAASLVQICDRGIASQRSLVMGLRSMVRGPQS
ncbi:MAG: hypothetical protein GY812_16265 [Actinomycetia bacterium]|nr:hypothetical protein [Actinomycetes bacterium]